MNIALEIMSVSEETGDGIDLVHCIVGVIDDGRAQEKAEDLLSSHIVHKKTRDFFGLERAPPHICFGAQRTIFAIVRARVGKECLKENCVTALRQRNGIDPFSLPASFSSLLIPRAAGTGEVVARIL